MVKKILVVDDSPTWRMFHSTALRKCLNFEYELTLAKSATEAAALIAKSIDEPFNLIITDLQMELDYEPDCAGEWLVKEIRNYETYKNIPIIIISAMYNIEAIGKSLSVPFIHKSSLANDYLILKLKLQEIFSI